MNSGLFSTIRDIRQWISALSAIKRLGVLLGSGGVFLVSRGIATAEEQDTVVVLAASALSVVSALIALYSIYAVIRPFISSVSLSDGEK